MEAAAGPLALSISRGRRKDLGLERENVRMCSIYQSAVIEWEGQKMGEWRVFCQQREPEDYRRDMDWNIKLVWWRSGAWVKIYSGKFYPLAAQVSEAFIPLSWKIK